MQKEILLLIVEDNADLRKLLANHLRNDYHCTATETAEAAVKLLTRCSFDLVLTDLLLPGASGLELCQRVQADHPETGIIIMSASPDLRYEVEATRRGAFDYLRKPFNLSRLESALQQSLRHQTLCRELPALAATSR